MRNVKNAECKKCGVLKMRSVIAPRRVLAQRPNPRRHDRSPHVNINMICGEYRLYTG